MELGSLLAFQQPRYEEEKEAGKRSILQRYTKDGRSQNGVIGMRCDMEWMEGGKRKNGVV